jgi:hypothetical protein
VYLTIGYVNGRRIGAVERAVLSAALRFRPIMCWLLSSQIQEVSEPAFETPPQQESAHAIRATVQNPLCEPCPELPVRDGNRNRRLTAAGIWLIPIVLRKHTQALSDRFAKRVRRLLDVYSTPMFIGSKWMTSVGGNAGLHQGWHAGSGT